MLFASGVPKEHIDSLTYEEANLLMYGFRNGAFGTLQQAQRDYVNYCLLHNLIEITVAVNSKKRKKVKKPVPFSEYAPGLCSLLGIKQESNLTTSEKVLEMMGITQEQLDAGLRSKD